MAAKHFAEQAGEEYGRGLHRLRDAQAGGVEHPEQVSCLARPDVYMEVHYVVCEAGAEKEEQKAWGEASLVGPVP